MIEIVYLIVCLAMLIIMMFIYGYLFHGLWINRRHSVDRGRSNWPRVALVIPCKDADPELEDNLRRHFQHDYPDYRIIFTLADPDDPACPVIRRIIDTERSASLQRRPASMVIAPRLADCVEKVSNQIAAFQAVGADVDVLVCVDADGLPRDRDWLMALVASLERCSVASGFRWYIPDRPSFVGYLQSAWDANWCLGHARGKTVWGGAMAFTRATYSRLHFEDHLRSALTDDLVLQRCTHRAGENTGFTPGAMVISRPAQRFMDFFRWAVRQSQIVRLVAPSLWFLGFRVANAFAVFYLLSLALFFVPGVTWLLPATALAALALFYLGRGYLDYKLVRQFFPDHPDKTASLRWVYYWANPLADLLLPFVAYASLFSSTISWRGIHYRIKMGRVIRVCDMLQAPEGR